MGCLCCAGDQEPVPGLSQPGVEWKRHQRERRHCQVSGGPADIHHHLEQSGQPARQW